MIRGVVAARISYVGGAIFFALIAMAITARAYGFGPLVVFSVLLPTAIVASVASLKLISSTYVRPVWVWLLAGVIVPIVCVFGFLETSILVARLLTGVWSMRTLYWLTAEVAVTITVPLGVVGHLLLRWLIKARIDSAGRSRDAVSA